MDATSVALADADSGTLGGTQPQPVAELFTVADSFADGRRECDPGGRRWWWWWWRWRRRYADAVSGRQWRSFADCRARLAWSDGLAELAHAQRFPEHTGAVPVPNRDTNPETNSETHTQAVTDSDAERDGVVRLADRSKRRVLNIG